MLHELGLKAIEYWLDKYPELIHSRFNKSYILKALKRVLKKNDFIFNEEFFHQTIGNAMGTVVAQTYATLIMGYLEIIMIIIIMIIMEIKICNCIKI